VAHGYVTNIKILQVFDLVVDLHKSRIVAHNKAKIREEAEFARSKRVFCVFLTPLGDTKQLLHKLYSPQILGFATIPFHQTASKTPISSSHQGFVVAVFK